MTATLMKSQNTNEEDIFSQRMNSPEFKDKYGEIQSDNNIEDGEDVFSQRMNSPEFKDKYEESALASGFRSFAQIPQGIAEGTTYGQLTGLHSLLAMDVYDPEEIEHLKMVSEREGIPFDEEAYLEAANRAMGTIPTISNIASKIEEKTGLPLEPKTENQKRVRFLSMATKAVAPKGNLTKAMQPTAKVPTALSFRGLNTQLPAPILGAGVTATRELLMQMGVPEQFADLAAFGILKPTTEGAPSFISSQKKPSGLTTRRYEKLTEPTEIAGKKIQQIQQETSKEVKNLGKEIIKESPVGETYQKMKEDISYKRSVEEGFEEVRKLAGEQKGEMEYSNLKEKLKSKIPREKGLQVTPVTKEKSKLFKEFINDLGEGKATIAELENRYRKNNENATKAYDPGQSWESNQAKREAYFEYNQAIADVFEEVAPNTEFLNQFRQRNSEWKSLMDAEMIDNFLDQMTKGKIKYEKGRDFFKKKGMDTKFKRALGKEGYHKFETLMKDLMSTEEAFNLLQKKPDPGLLPFVKKAMYFAIDPSLGKAKFGFDLLKGGYQKMFEMLLDKPELAVNWDRGINALKKGDIKVANQELGKVAQAEKAVTERQEAVAKYKDFMKQRADKTKNANEVKESAKGKIEQPKAVKEVLLVPEKEIEQSKAAVKKKEPLLLGEKPTNESFTTEKGSTYSINKEGKTIRNKAFRKEHGEKEKGIQPISEKTYYLKKDDANKLGEFQAQGEGKKIVEMKDGSLGVQYTSGKDKGKIEARTIVKPENKPSIGLMPLEIWDNGKKAHFGNKITNIKKSANLAEIKQSVEQLENKIEKVKRQDISKKGLKEQKLYLMDKITEVLDNPKKFEGKAKIHIDVPGDGEFNLNNKPEVLEKLLKKIDKGWPDKAMRTSTRKKYVEYSEDQLKPAELKRQTEEKAYMDKYYKENTKKKK